jgi:hypothetical protein
MICIGLERFFGLPIIPAPKRNSNLRKEIWTNACIAEGLLGARSVRATLHDAATSDTPVSHDVQALPSARAPASFAGARTQSRIIHKVFYLLYLSWR